MLEFFSYLTPLGQQIIAVVEHRKFNIRQNAPICRKRELMGIVVGRSLTICLDNIKNALSPVDHYVNETINHESVHIAQYCKGGRLGVVTALDKYKSNDARRSNIFGKSDLEMEKEAYELEDKPEEVLYYLRTYCL